MQQPTPQALVTADKPLYRYWQALYMSFYASRLYVDVLKRWRGFGIRYLLLVMFLGCIPLSLGMILNFDTYFHEQLIEPIQDLPTLVIKEGVVVFEKPMPYLVHDPKGQVVAIIDTTGRVNDLDETYPNLRFLVTKSAIYFRPPTMRLRVNDPAVKGQAYVQKLDPQINEVFIGHEWLQSSGVLRVKWITEAMVYPSLSLFIFGFYLIFLFSLALLGQVCSQVIFKFKLSFKESCRLMAVASTPMLFLFLSFLALDWMVVGLGYLYVGLLALYFSYAVLSVKRESQQLVIR